MRRNPKKKNAITFLILIFIVSFFISYLIDKQAMPLLEYYAETQGISKVTEIINDSVEKSLSENNYKTNNFVSYEKNNSGELSAINIDTKKLNSLKATLTADVIRGLREISNTSIKIPFGTLTGIGIFYGMGPDIKVDLIPEGSVTSDIETDFYSSGINQTVHRIYCTIDTKFFVVLPDKTISFSVPCQFLLSETVIVGDIPQVYFQNQGE